MSPVVQEKFLEASPVVVQLVLPQTRAPCVCQDDGAVKARDLLVFRAKFESTPVSTGQTVKGHSLTTVMLAL